MVALALKSFGGMVPATDPRLLPDMQAEEAVNVDLSTGILRGFSGPNQAHSFGATSYRRAYRFPNPFNANVQWLGLPSEWSSVVRSPLANDVSRRVYWTNPGDDIPWWSTYENIRTSVAPYNLGIVQPSSAPVAAVTGGSATSVSRSYVYTFSNEFGEESAPCRPSNVASGPSDGTWTVTGLPTTAPANPAGINYPPVTTLTLYRTVTGVTSGASFYRVTEFEFDGSPPTSPYTDTTLDTTVTNNETLLSTDWGNPPTGLDGLTVLPGGMMVGFADNTVHFCEIDRPHAWPAGYDQSVHYDVVGLASWQQSLVVLTKGFPSVGSGNSPVNFIFQQISAAEPCLARGSIVTDLSGVFYASPNGLILLNYNGIKNQTIDLITPEQWVDTYHAADIVACRHKSQYLAINGTGAGFTIDFHSKKLGVVDFSTFEGATAIWSDEFTGDTYVQADTRAYKWDDSTTHQLVYRWKSKELYGPLPSNFGACQVMIDPSIEETLDATAPALSNGDDTLDLPAGINAIFRLYADGVMVHEQNLLTRQEIFRLPSGYLAFTWQVEIVSRVPVFSIELGSTMKELKRVPTS